MSANSITSRLAELQSWRYGWQHQIDQLIAVLDAENMGTIETIDCLALLREQLDHERVTLAFVAEVGRGKSELINTLFFSDLGRPLLPSGEGRGTRCVNEIRFDMQREPSIRLLPIESREDTKSYHELLADEDQWRTLSFDAADASSVSAALAELSQTMRVPFNVAVSWGLHGEGLAEPVVSTNDSAQALVEIARWRHAIINFPHPLLEAGLVIIDTPGFAALSSEPELSQHRLPNADAILLVLDINDGAGKADMAIWKDLLGGNRNLRERVNAELSQAKLVVLNKLDLLESSGSGNIDAEIKRRVSDTAALLRLNTDCVLPVSAALATYGKSKGESAAIERSLTFEMEAALVAKLPQNRQEKLSAEATETVSATYDAVQSGIDQTRLELLQRLQQLNVLRHKNEKLIETLNEQTATRHDKIDAASKEMRGLKSIHARLADELAERVNPQIARKQADQTRHAIAASLMPGATQQAVENYFTASRRQIELAEAKIDEVKAIFGDVAARFQRDLDLRDAVMIPFPTQRFHSELQKAKMASENEFMRAGNLISKFGKSLGEQFEDLVTLKIVHIFDIANRETSIWIRALYVALEKALGTARSNLNQRIEHIEKMEGVELDLAERIAEMQAQLDVVKRRHERLNEARNGLNRFLGKPPHADNR